MLTLDKIFTAVSSTAFVHTLRYNQRKIESFEFWKLVNSIIHQYFCVEQESYDASLKSVRAEHTGFGYSPNSLYV